MITKSTIIPVLVLMAASVSSGQQTENQTAVVLDEGLWVTFYDVPSRRFRAIRTAVLMRNHDSAARDLTLAAGFVSVEAARSSDVFRGPLDDVADRLQRLARGVESVTLEELDALFGRAHWLLAQHYLAFAREARNARNNRNTSLYLWATIHHVERAVVWSNVAVTREVHATLEGLQDLAAKLRDPKTAERAYRERPIVRAENLLEKLGRTIDRPVLLPMSESEEPGSDAEP